MAPPSFSLDIIQSGVTLYLVKTIQTGLQSTYAVVTAVNETSHPAIKRVSITSFFHPIPVFSSAQQNSARHPIDGRHALIDDSSAEQHIAPPVRSWEPSRTTDPVSGNSLQPQISCAQLLQETDWESTLAGPLEDWPPELQSAIRLLFASSDQDLIWVGKDMRLI